MPVWRSEVITAFRVDHQRNITCYTCARARRRPFREFTPTFGRRRGPYTLPGPPRSRCSVHASLGPNFGTEVEKVCAGFVLHRARLVISAEYRKTKKVSGMTRRSDSDT